MKKGKAKAQFKRALVSLLTAALVASGSFGLTTITSSASVANVELSDPLKFSVYANVYTNSNHVEGNVAIGSLQASLDIWEGKSYIGDLANPNASFKCNVRDAIVAFAANNSDGTTNVIVDQPGQGYKLTVVSRGTGEEAEDVVVREFITDNKMIGYECRTDIASRISTVINACKNTSNELYALEDVETDNLLVLNISAADFNGNGDYYDRLITESASAGKTVVVNVSDSGSVVLYYSMNATTVGGGLGHQSWAGNIVWNFGNASSVSTGGIFGTILAPSASVTNSANIVGAVIANSFAQGGEVHQVNYTRGIPNPPPTPTPEVPEEPEETPTPEVTPTPTPEVPEETPTPEVTPTPTPEVPEETPTPEATPTPTPEVTPTPTPEATPTPTPVVTPTPTPVVTPTPAPETTPTPTPVVTPTPTPVVTPTPTPEATPTPTPEVTPTPTPVVTPTPTPEATPTPTPVTTPAPTPTPPVSTPTPTPPVVPPTPTPPVTTTPTPTPPVSTPTPTPTPDVEETPTPTPDTVPTPPPEDPPEVQGVRRFVVIEDEDTPLSDASVLGADRRPQTGDASDVWTIAFLASISGLAAWILQGKKK